MSQVHDDSRLFVLEIGTEEMPPQDVVDASQQVQSISYISVFFFFKCILSFLKFHEHFES